jgi:hypothetical protein
VKQVVPLAANAVGEHTGLPLEQSIAAAVTQSFVGVHAAPWLHATHVPDPLHTPPGHGVPAPAFPVALHTGPPELQSIVPLVHGFPVLHPAPAEHDTHEPLPLHTPPGQPDPAPTFPAKLHTGLPLLQSVVPF